MQSSDAMNELAQIPERATAAACFGAPASAGERTVIPVAEVSYGLGLGWGGSCSAGDEDGEGGAGAGGGGSRVRGIAVIEVSPGGVQVHPIVDQTQITLAGIAFASAATAITARALQKLIRG